MSVSGTLCTQLCSLVYLQPEVLPSADRARHPQPRCPNLNPRNNGLRPKASVNTAKSNLSLHADCCTHLLRLGTQSQVVGPFELQPISIVLAAEEDIRDLSSTGANEEHLLYLRHRSLWRWSARTAYDDNRYLLFRYTDPRAESQSEPAQGTHFSTSAGGHLRLESPQ
ncbi:hypothetical protein C8F01DRAFT_153490 [Mycena amicta]|nr:hypothetical protein C8F01DRAFT_153490 [Mycena amicta]